ncbi:MAG: protein kinase [Verrucomicrobia bacterium]|nr:protein kinase [Verrucomicrobiota bacterium]
MGNEAIKQPSVVRELFLEALELPTEAEQTALLDRVADRALRKKVEALLGSYRSRGLFEEPAIGRTGDHAPATVSPPETAGTRIGRYTLLEQIGEGGFGIVYLAEQEEPVRRQVALKIIKLGMDTRQVIARFEAERQALAVMDHPNIAKVLDGGVIREKAEGRSQKEVGETTRQSADSLLPSSFSLHTSGHGRPYFVMELVRGLPITRFCEEHRLTVRERLELFLPVCHAIQHAHQKGIIHRDIKPSNVLVTEIEGVPHPRVIDFGVAKAIDTRQTEKAHFTRFAQLIGTPPYMSPEQADPGPAGARDVDTRTDVYSLGILLYELLTGTTPFSEEHLRAAGYAEVQRIITHEEPAQPSTLITRLNGKLRALASNRRCEPAALVRSIKGDLDWIVLKAIDKDRNRRYATPNELAADIQRHLNNEPIQARPTSSAEKLWRWCRRNPAVTSLSAGLVLALVAGLVGTLWHLNRANHNTAENRRQIARLHVLNGVNLMQDGDQFKSLLWFAEALSLPTDPPGPTAVDQLRIGSIVAMGPQLTAVITHDGQPVADAAFHPRQDQLATVGRDRRLRLWTVPGGEPILVTEPLDEPPSHVLFAPNGQRILVVSSEFNHAWFFSTSEGQNLTGPIPHLMGGANNRPLPPRFDPSGELLLTQTAPRTLQLWNVQDASPLGSPLEPGSAVAWMNFTTDGQHILLRLQDGRLLATDWRTGQQSEIHSSASPVASFPSVPSVRSLAPSMTWPHDLPGAIFDHTHQRLLTFGRDRFARLVDATTGTSLLPPIEHLSLVQSAVFSPDRTRFATATAGGRVQVSNADTGEPLTPLLDHNPATTPVEFSASGRFLFTMHPAHAIYVWDLSETNEPPVLLRPGTPGTFTESGQEGSVFVTRDLNRPIRVRALAGAAEVSLHPSSLKLIPVQAWFDQTGQFVILEGENQRAQVWHAATGLPVTPIFHSRYAAIEADYRTVKLSAISESPITNPQSSILNPPDLRPMAELLSGSRLDGTGGWQPLELGEIVQRWDGLAGEHASFANRLNQ